MALQNLRSNTAHKRPTPASMSDGQIALNTNATDTGLFFKDASGNLVKAGPVSVGTSAPNSSAAGSSGNSVGEIWLDTTSSNYIVKVWDGTAWRFDAGLAYLAGLSFTDESTFKQSVNLEIGVDVQAYDADTTKNDVANTFVPAQTFTAQSVHNGGIDVNGNIDVSGNIVAQGTLDLTDNLIIADKIIHSQNTGTRIRFPAQDTFTVETNSSERFRVTSTGAIAVGGASNYGTSGQVLTSNGNGAPTWQDASGGGGGGELDFVASGAVGNGDAVIVNSDGTVSVIAESGTGSPSVGNVATVASAQVDITAAVYDSSNDKVIVAYKDNSDSSRGKAVVGTVEGNSISFGSPVTFNNAGTNYISAAFDSNANAVVISYRDEGNSNRGTAIAGTVSGDSITFGSEVVFYMNATERTSAVFDSNSNKVVVAYVNGLFSRAEAVVLSVSGTTITLGSSGVFYYSSVNQLSTTFDSNANKVVIAFRPNDGQYYGRAVVVTVSGTSISFGTATVFQSASTNYISATFDSNSNKVVIVYQDVGNNYLVTGIVGTVSGTSISFGSEVLVDSVNQGQGTAVVFDSKYNKVVVRYKASGQKISVGTVSGTSISFGSFVSAASGIDSNDVAGVFDPDTEKTVFAAYNPNSSAGEAVVFRSVLRDTNLDGNFLGFAKAAISNGSTGTISIVGGVNESQSGLTVGKSYYVRNDGTLSTKLLDQDVHAGISIASTKIITKG